MLINRKKEFLISIFIITFILLQIVVYAKYPDPTYVKLSIYNMAHKVDGYNRPGRVWYAMPGEYITANTPYIYAVDATGLGKQYVDIGDVLWNKDTYNPYGTAMFWKQSGNEYKVVWDFMNLDLETRNTGKFKTFLDKYPKNSDEAPNDDVYEDYGDNDKEIIIEPKWNKMVSRPIIEFEMLSPMVQCANVGDEVTLKFKITNNSPYDLPAADIKISKGIFADDILNQTVPGFRTYEDDNRSMIVEYTYKIKENDPDEIKFDANFFPMYSYTSDGAGFNGVRGIPDTYYLTQAGTINVLRTGLTVKKTVDNNMPSQGDTVTYRFEVQNIGKITLNDIKIDDIMDVVKSDSSDSHDVPQRKVDIMPKVKDTLAPGEKFEFIGKYKVTELDVQNGKVIRNIAVAKAKASTKCGTEVEVKSEESYVDFEVKRSNLKVEKIVDKKEAKVSDTLNYTVKITNTGETILKILQINDVINNKNIALTGNLPLMIQPGISMEFNGSYVVLKEDVKDNTITNIATVKAIDLNGNNIPDGVSQVETIIKDEGLKIVKSTKESALPGETIIYTFVVTNTGDTTIRDITIDDTLIDKSTLEPRSYDSLDKGASVTFTAKYTIPMDKKAKDIIANTGAAIGRGLNDSTIKSNESIVECTIVQPTEAKISISKTVDNLNPKTSDTVTYTIKVSNIGNTVLSNIKVEDRPLVYVKNINKLGIGESKTFTIAKKVTEKSGSFTNVATATVENGPSCEASVTYNVINEELSLVKTVNNATPVVGETITYTFIVTNTGNTVIKNVTINDSLIDDSTLEPQSFLNLEPGKTVKFIAKYTIPDYKKVVNVANAVGSGVNGSIIKSNDGRVVCTVMAAATKPGISVSETIDNKFPKTSDTVNYTITVTNSGNTRLSNIRVVDESLGYSDIITNLEPGKSEVIMLKKVVTEQYGSFTNTVVVNSGELSDKASVTYNVLKESLSLEKKVNNKNPILGESVTYTFTVKNTGNTTIKDIKVDDPLIDMSTLNPQSVASLAPNESAVFEATYTISQNATVGYEIVNTAKAFGKGMGDSVITSPSSSTTLKIIENPVKPGISVSKSVDKVRPTKGQAIIYTIKLANTGNSDLNNIEIVDELLGYRKNIEVLQVGKYAKIELARKVTEDPGKSFTSTVKVKADGLNEVSSSVTYTVVKVQTKKLYLPKVGEKIETDIIKYFIK